MLNLLEQAESEQLLHFKKVPDGVMNITISLHEVRFQTWLTENDKSDWSFDNFKAYLEDTQQAKIPYKSLSTLQAIGKVLDYINTIDQPPFRTDSQIMEEIGIFLPSRERIMILNKLEKDEYVYTEIDANGVKRYYPCFEGRFFSERGGYNKEKSEKITATIANKFITAITIINIFVIAYLTFENNKIQKDANETKDLLIETMKLLSD